METTTMDEPSGMSQEAWHIEIYETQPYAQWPDPSFFRFRLVDGDKNVLTDHTLETYDSPEAALHAATVAYPDLGITGEQRAGRTWELRH